MKKTFPGFYRPTKVEFRVLWDTARFVPDANVLLNLYGYSASTRKKLLELFEGIGQRLWMPYQFAAEYQRNRVKAVVEQIESYRSIKTQLKSVLDQHLRPIHRHPFITKKSMKAFEQICEELDKGRREHEALLTEDPIFARVTSLLTDRVGPKPTAEQLQQMFDDAKERYAAKVPPGYADKKPEPDLYGDYVGWRQILDFGGNPRVPVILVTDDRKDDWWHTRRVAGEQTDRRIGPRPELIAEFRSVCNESFYMYTLEQFIERAQEYLGRKVGPAALLEVKERSAAQTVLQTETKPLDELKLTATGTLHTDVLATPESKREDLAAEEDEAEDLETKPEI